MMFAQHSPNPGDDSNLFQHLAMEANGLKARSAELTTKPEPELPQADMSSIAEKN